MSVAAREQLGENEDEERTSLRAQVVAVGQRWAADLRNLVRLAVELEASGDWTLDGAPSCAHWIADALDVEASTAREWLRIGRALTTLEIVDDAFEQGRLSYSKVRTLTRLATAANQAELVTVAEGVPAGRLGHALAAWLNRNETSAETEARHHAARGVGWRLDFDGMVRGWFRLCPADAGVLSAAIDALVQTRHQPDRRERHASADAPEWERAARWPSFAQQRADALVELVAGGGATVRAEIVMHVRADGCRLDDGTPIAGSIVERIAPAAFLRALIHDAESRPINASGRQRHPTTRQRRVVRAREEVCVDCGATDFLQYDHEPGYDESHRTLVDDLRPRCPRCHRDRHRRMKNAS
jgi:hypothetical protein